MRNEIVVFWDDGELSIYADVRALRQHVEPWMPEAGAVKGAWRLDGSRIDLVLTDEGLLNLRTPGICDQVGLEEAIRTAYNLRLDHEEGFGSLVDQTVGAIGITEYQSIVPLRLRLRLWIHRLIQGR